MYEDDDIYYQEAKKRIKEVKKFYKHLSSFVIIGLFFFLLNMSTDPSEVWFFIPMLGWGIGLAFHYIKVFGIPLIGSLDKKWEDQKIREEIASMKGQKHRPLLAEDNHEIDDLDLDSDNYRGFDIEDDYQTRDMQDLRSDFRSNIIP